MWPFSVLAVSMTTMSLIYTNRRAAWFEQVVLILVMFESSARNEPRVSFDFNTFCTIYPLTIILVPIFTA